MLESLTSSMKRTSVVEVQIGDGLASVDLWGIVDKFKETPPSNVDPKMKKKISKACQE